MRQRPGDGEAVVVCPVMDEEGAGESSCEVALEPLRVREPGEPTREERARHEQTHRVPTKSWCVCVCVMRRAAGPVGGVFTLVPSPASGGQRAFLRQWCLATAPSPLPIATAPSCDPSHRDRRRSSSPSALFFCSKVVVAPAERAPRLSAISSAQPLIRLPPFLDFALRRPSF